MVREDAVEKAKRRVQEKLGEKLSLPENAGKTAAISEDMVLVNIISIGRHNNQKS